MDERYRDEPQNPEVACIEMQLNGENVKLSASNTWIRRFRKDGGMFDYCIYINLENMDELQSFSPSEATMEQLAAIGCRTFVFDDIDPPAIAHYAKLQAEGMDEEYEHLRARSQQHPSLPEHQIIQLKFGEKVATFSTEDTIIRRFKRGNGEFDHCTHLTPNGDIRAFTPDARTLEKMIELGFSVTTEDDIDEPTTEHYITMQMAHLDGEINNFNS